MTRPAQDPIARYRGRHAVTGPWRIHPEPGRTFAQAVVIPALAERENLPAVLDSLAAQDAAESARTLVLVVVNQRDDHGPEIAQDNADSLRFLHEMAAKHPCTVGIIDAASPGSRLPPKQGVGLARRIGMDAALAHLELDGPVPPLMCSLDADSPVAPRYLTALREAFGGERQMAAVIGFEHPKDGPNASAIIEYEAFLHNFVQGLRWAGSPYAFHTIGSAFVCTAEAYALADGMPQRQAGEDFYFLQKLAKAVPVKSIEEVLVYPAARTSWRVPFGTGARITQRIEPGAKPIRAYAPSSYRVLRDWLHAMTEHPQAAAEEQMQRAAALDPALPGFLDQIRFASTWTRWQQAPLPPERAGARIHTWFDGFKTLKLLHHLRDHGHPMVSLNEWRLEE